MTEKFAARKVLILSASAGAGHVRAAEAMLEQCRLHPLVGEVQHWDMLHYTTAIFRHLYSQVYLDLINKAPKMLGWIYDKTDTPWKNEKLRLAFEKFNAGPFLRAATAFKPDVIICTHFTPAVLVAWLYEKGKIPVKPAIVVTDFDCHAMWLARSYLHYFVALEETRQHLMALGIASDAVSVSGIPVMASFARPLERGAARQGLSLDTRLFTVLVSAGGFGVGPVELLIGQLLSIKVPVQIVVIAGRSEALKSKLDRMVRDIGHAGPVRLHAVGFTNRMDEYMAAADILLGKPGGLTTSEAMARHLPMCIVNPIPGQEERNSDHLLELGMAIRCNNLPALGWKLESLMGNPAKLQAMQRATDYLCRPNAAEDIVRKLLDAPPVAGPEEAGPRRLRQGVGGRKARKALLS